MDFNRARSRDTFPVFWLEIDGYHRVFYSGTTAPTVGAGYTTTPGLTAPSRLSARANLMDATVRPSTCSVRVGRIDGVDIQDLRRRAPGGATRFVTLAASIPQSGAAPYTVAVNESITSWPASGTLWIGQEALQYVSKDVGLKTFTVNALGRGYLGSQVMEHVAAPSEGWAPRVYSECVTWTNRRARVWTDEQLIDGTLAGEARCEIDGWLRGAPIDAGSGMYEVQLESVSAVLDIEVGGVELTTGLQHGEHAFDGENAHLLNTVALAWATGAAWSVRTTLPSLAAGTAILGIPWDTHSAVFDNTLLDARRGWISVGVNRYRPTTAGAYVGFPSNGTGSINIAGALVANIAAGELVQNTEVVHFALASTLTTPGTAEVVGWPAEAMDRILTTVQPGTKAGANGLWADIDWVAAPSGNTLGFVTNIAAEISGQYEVRMSNPGAQTCIGFCLGQDMPVNTSTGLHAPGWAHEPQKLSSFSGNAPSLYVPIRGVALAWHSPAETWLHVEDDVFGSPTAAQPIQVQATLSYGGEERTTSFTIIGKAAASTVTVGAKGWLLEKAPGSFGVGLPLADWAGQPATSIRQVVRWVETSPPIIMLQLLMSSEGAGYTSADYDVLPFGAALESSQVDIASFERYTVPAQGRSAHRTYELLEGKSLRAFLADLAKSISAAMVERLDRSTGRRVIALVKAGHPSRFDSAATIADGDWASQDRPRGVDDRKVVNSVKALMNWDADEPGLTVIVNDRDSIGDNRRTEREELQLHGVTIRASSVSAQRAALFPIAAERFGLWAYRRIVVRGGLCYSDALLLDPGSVVTFSATDVDDYDATRGLSDAIGIVQSITRTPDKQQATVEIVYWGTRVSGWAPAMSATAAPAADQLTVSANAFSDAADPITGGAVTDAGFFAVGDAVEVVPIGDWPNRVTTTITGIVGATITLGAAHGLAGPYWGTIRPQAYDAGTATMRAYVFAADDAGTLGAAADAAFVYA